MFVTMVQSVSAVPGFSWSKKVSPLPPSPHCSAPDHGLQRRSISSRSDCGCTEQLPGVTGLNCTMLSATHYSTVHIIITITFLIKLFIKIDSASPRLHPQHPNYATTIPPALLHLISLSSLEKNVSVFQQRQIITVSLRTEQNTTCTDMKEGLGALWCSQVLLAVSPDHSKYNQLIIYDAV